MQKRTDAGDAVRPASLSIRALASVERIAVRLLNWKRRRRVQPANNVETEKPIPPGHVKVGHERSVTWKRVSGSRPVSITKDEIGKHVCFHARTGAGKSVAIVNLALAWIAARRGLIIPDPDGTLSYQIVAALSRFETPDSIKDRLLFVSLDETDWVVPLNVLLGADESAALLLYDGIEKQWGGSFGPVVGRSMRAAIFTAARAGLTFGDLPLLYRSPELRSRIIGQADPISQRFWTQYDREFSPDERRAYAAPVENRLETWLSSSIVGAMLSHPRGLHLREMFAKRPDLVVVVNLASRRAAGSSRLVASLFFAQVLSQLMHPERAATGTKPILVVCDEYQNLASEEAIMTCLGESRKYKVCVCLASQVFSRLSKPLRDSILGNCFCTFAFSSGDTADFAPYIHFEGDPLPKSEIAAFLARQKVGESVLIRPGQYSVPVKHLPPPKEVMEADQNVVQALIGASYKVYALPRAQMLREIEERQAALMATLASDGSSGSPEAHNAPPQARRRSARPLIGGKEENDA